MLSERALPALNQRNSQIQDFDPTEQLTVADPKRSSLPCVSPAKEKQAVAFCIVQNEIYSSPKHRIFHGKTVREE